MLDNDILNDPKSVKPWHAAWQDAANLEDDDQELIKIKAVKTVSGQSEAFTDVMESINKYLFCNRHSVADFQLMKDIVERNTGTLEDEVNLTLSTPLYLGLMGTMLGIVIGLFSMSHLMTAGVNDKGLATGIATLLGSVKIAMIGSFAGLAFTIINSAGYFRGTKYMLEAKKNAFYTLMQVQLLPTLNQGMSATLESLQRNLSRFNEGFDYNLDRLSGVFDRNYQAIQLNKELIDQLDSNKVAEMTKYNIAVLRELKESVEAFERFNILFSNVGEYVTGTYRLTDKTNELLERTDNFKTIAERIEETMGRNEALFEFLENHFKELEDFKNKVTETVTNVGFNVKDSFGDVSRTMAKAGEVLSAEAALRNEDSKKVFAEFTGDLKRSFKEQSDAYMEAVEKQKESFRLAVEEKKSNIDQLTNLGPLLSEVRSLRNAGGNYNTDKLLTQLSELNRMLRHIEDDINRPILKKIFTRKQR